jgi:uncharacterized protein YdhG (YjbR/CyaY superfamily)
MNRDITTIDDYIAQCPEKTQAILQRVREAIKTVVPTATEKIGYGIPTFVFNGKNLVHFAGYEHHIGFYPGSAPIEVFRDELSGYNTSKGTIQFPLGSPIPYELIKEITAFCVERNSDRNK